jgi:hypothetical protein
MFLHRLVSKMHQGKPGRCQQRLIVEFGALGSWCSPREGQVEGEAYEDPPDRHHIACVETLHRTSLPSIVLAQHDAVKPASNGSRFSIHPGAAGVVAGMMDLQRSALLHWSVLASSSAEPCATGSTGYRQYMCFTTPNLHTSLQDWIQ